MKPLDNARHEAFAQAIAKGMHASAAYVAAGYKPSEPHASRLARHGKVRERVAHLLARAAARVELTKADVLRVLMREACLLPDDPPPDTTSSARIQAARLLGLELQMFTERREHGVTEQLAELLRETKPLPVGLAPPPRPDAETRH